MESIKEIYRIGKGPSSSHTMGPQAASQIFLKKNPEADSFEVSLYKSLAATGVGHLTDKAIEDVFFPKNININWRAGEELPFHPNGMKFKAFKNNEQIDEWIVYSVGGGALSEGDAHKYINNVYEMTKLEEIISYCATKGITFWEFVEEIEGKEIWIYLANVWLKMSDAIKRGIKTEGVLPGGLGLPRKASVFHRRAKMSGEYFRRSGLVSSFALAVAEENAGGGIIVTAPTCGSCGVLPSVLRYLEEFSNCDEELILKALATAGLIGNIVKKNASIAGAEVGCQGEIGTACAMAAAAATQILGGTIHQIEYAAEMGLEHHLGLTCDPVNGMVQIPCIERNAFAAKRALSCADYAMFSDGTHRISFDDVVLTMKKTGHDLPSLYKETSEGGLAVVFKN